MKKQFLKLTCLSVMVLTLSLGCSKKGSDFEAGEAPSTPFSVKNLILEKSSDGEYLYFGWDVDGSYAIGMARLHPGTTCSYAITNNSSTEWSRWYTQNMGSPSYRGIFKINPDIHGCRFDYCIQSTDRSPANSELGDTEDNARTKCGSVQY